MAAEGKLHIEAIWDGSALSAASVASSRPVQAGRLMLGKPLQEAVDSVPLLFSICGRAQGVAAVMAAEAALDMAVPDAVREARARLVLGEMIHEYLWRILLDWPLQAGVPPRMQAMAEMRARMSAMLTPLLATGSWKTIGGLPPDAGDEEKGAFFPALQGWLREEVFGREPAQWLEMDTPETLEAWCADGHTPVAVMLHAVARYGRFRAGSVALMPPPDKAWLHEMAEAMRDRTFPQQPHWRGAALETGALARQRQHPLLQALTARQGHSIFARLVARLVELALAADGGHAACFGSQPLGGGAGISWVETARGLLMHRIASDGERVLACQIVAPTEWNFRENGALMQGLRGMPAASEDEALGRAKWLVQSLDPCVACDITLRQA